VALAVTLILLVAMTILGVAALTSTRLNEKITSNVQQKAVAFEVAESAINVVWVKPQLILESILNAPNWQYNEPDAVIPEGTSDLSDSFDQTTALGVSVDVTSSVTVQFCGETALPVGTDLSGDQSKPRMVGMMFDIVGVADVANSNADAVHVQRGYIPKPETFRTGACSVPQI